MKKPDNFEVKLYHSGAGNFGIVYSYTTYSFFGLIKKDHYKRLEYCERYTDQFDRENANIRMYSTKDWNAAYEIAKQFKSLADIENYHKAEIEKCKEIQTPAYFFNVL